MAVVWLHVLEHSSVNKSLHILRVSPFAIVCNLTCAQGEKCREKFNVDKMMANTAISL